MIEGDIERAVKILKEAINIESHPVLEKDLTLLTALSNFSN